MWRRAMNLVYEGVFVVSAVHGHPGVYWLRAFARGRRAVAVLTDVPWNAGGSAVNFIDQVSQEVGERVLPHAREIEWFTTYVSSETESEGYFARVRIIPGERARWDPRLEREDLEHAIGRALPHIPDAAELKERVLEAGGVEEEPAPPRRFVLIEPSHLPPPHNPSRCGHYERFKSLAVGPTRSDAIVAGTQFQDSLTSDDYRTCEYHQANWGDIVDVCVALLSQLGHEPDLNVVLERLASSSLSEDDRLWAWSLFHDPIVIGGGEYTNGQHRGCALRASGAPLVPVEARD